jgi:hypothetical protein
MSIKNKTYMSSSSEHEIRQLRMDLDDLTQEVRRLRRIVYGLKVVNEWKPTTEEDEAFLRFCVRTN